MLERYKKFLEEFDKQLAEYFDEHKQFLCCQKGCTDCCEIGDYPFSRLEAEYIMSGYLTLPPEKQQLVKQNISNLKTVQKNQMYKCPFLDEKECILYKYRGIVCRTFGLAYLDNGKVKLPECANFGLNYSQIYDLKNHTITLENPITENLRTDEIFKSKLAQKYQLECGEIRPLKDWFNS